VPRTCLVAVLALLGCGDEPPPGVEDLTLDAPTDHHARHGFVNMVAPIHLPSSRADADQVEVWLRVPDGAEIEARPGPGGEPLLEFPIGTVADRVEFVGLGPSRRVVDIRGAEIVEGDQLFHVYRPTAPRSDAPLFGVQWRREDVEAHRGATDRLVAKLAKVEEIEELAKREAFLRDVRGKNACMPCHAPARPENVQPREHGLVNRGTDHSGFFTPSTVLRDEIPLESYAAHDLSLRDPAIEVSCAEGGELEGRTCTNGQVPRGKWSFVRAWSLNPGRARQVCAARRYLVERMSEQARAIFGASLTPCNQRQEAEY
jgi:hypothetical protein